MGKIWPKHHLLIGKGSSKKKVPNKYDLLKKTHYKITKKIKISIIF